MEGEGVRRSRFWVQLWGSVVHLGTVTKPSACANLRSLAKNIMYLSNSKCTQIVRCETSR